MGPSLESSRPILASNPNKRTSQRYSSYSASPSIAVSEVTVASTTSSSDPRVAEIKEFTESLDRLEQKRLQQQRFVPSQEKSESLSKLALGAKVERALRRRMTSQDAVFTSRTINEKSKRL
ncbi:hypothetical protein FGG08_005797 [Glutinoglossum americanum]|uniref:Uncharacterized protein n=1 Tax=Glutinoglossum americanum TaxID=1670608 RepID=A0A9P8HZM9_9PEZI|nr:hypothetical protein FGG08_005797 [Glutinoglossum americanum]